MSYQGLNNSRTVRLLITLAILLVSSLALAEFQPDPSIPRSDIPEEYQWSKTDLFPDIAAWETELAALREDIPKLKRFRGRMAESSETLLQAHHEVYALVTRFSRLRTYSAALFDVDMGNSEYRQMSGKVSLLGPVFGEATSWMESPQRSATQRIGLTEPALRCE